MFSKTNSLDKSLCYPAQVSAWTLSLNLRGCLVSMSTWSVSLLQGVTVCYFWNVFLGLKKKKDSLNIWSEYFWRSFDSFGVEIFFRPQHLLVAGGWQPRGINSILHVMRISCFKSTTLLDPHTHPKKKKTKIMQLLPPNVLNSSFRLWIIEKLGKHDGFLHFLLPNSYDRRTNRQTDWELTVFMTCFCLLLSV